MLSISNLVGLGILKTPSFISFITSTTSSTANITVPASAQAKDVCFLADFAYNPDNQPANVVPADFTQIATEGMFNIEGLTLTLSYKLLTASDPGSVKTGLANNSNDGKIMLIFRGLPPVIDTSAVGTSDVTIGNPAVQTVTTSSLMHPVIVIGVCADASTAATFTVTSPSFDSEITLGNVLRVGYKIYNPGTALSNHTIDASDDSADALGSCYIRC